jgi:hypothetical protein
MNLQLIEKVCMWTGAAVLSACAISLAIAGLWLVAEVFLGLEERICQIMRVQKPLMEYLINYKLYKKVIADYKAKQKDLAA